MEMVCLTQKRQKDGLQVYSSDGTPNLHAIDLAKLLAKWSDVSAPELGPTDAFTNVKLATYIDTESGIVPKCDSSVPPGADFSEAMDPADLAAALK